jgi:hypothetical protein
MPWSYAESRGMAPHFLTSVLDRDDQKTSHFDCLTHGEMPLDTNWRGSWTQSRSGHCGDDRISLHFWVSKHGLQMEGHWYTLCCYCMRHRFCAMKQSYHSVPMWHFLGILQNVIFVGLRHSKPAGEHRVRYSSTVNCGLSRTPGYRHYVKTA